MTSEADLDTEIKGLSILSEHSDLYEEFAKMGCVASLTSLLSHENADIAIDVVQIINELTDEDVEAEQEQWDALVNAMVCCGMVPSVTTLTMTRWRPISSNCLLKIFPDSMKGLRQIEQEYTMC